MNRRLLLLVIIIIASFFPFVMQTRSNTQGTVPGQIRLFMFREGTGGLRTGTNMIYAALGDTISIDIFIRNPRLIPVTAIEVYFTIENDYFDIVSQGTNTDLQYYYGHDKPFIQGKFLSRAFGSVPPWGNNTHNDTLNANDNGLNGWQLDYAEITPRDMGEGRPSSSDPYGVVATLQLVCKAPCDSASFLLDRDKYNQRISAYFEADANDNFYFQSFQTCYITVSGVAINPPLPDKYMVPGTIDTTLNLLDHVGLSSLDESDIVWSYSGNNHVGVSIDPQTQVVTFSAPSDFKGYEDIEFTLGSGTETYASDTMRVTVGHMPVLDTEALHDTLKVHEDSLESVLALREVVSDADDVFEDLEWEFSLSENITPSVASDSLFLQGAQNYFGSEFMTIRVFDGLGLGDSLDVPVEVLPVNDAPTLAGLPDISIQRGDDHTFNIMDYAQDVDGDSLGTSWGSTEHLLVSVDGQVVTIEGAPGYLGEEALVLTVSDPGGLAASDTMTVTLTEAHKPPVWSALPKIGFAQGDMDSSLVLWDYVEDPDDADSLLTFEITNDDDVDLWMVNNRNGKLYLYDLDNSIGWDRLTVTAFDPDGNLSSTQFLVFVAPSDGTPIVGGIPDTTMVAGSQADWIDLDDFYYDVDNTDTQMTWSWSREASADSSVTVSINRVSHRVQLSSLGYDLFGVNKIIFTVTDPDAKFADDICLISIVEELNRPSLDLPPKVGFIAGNEVELDLDDYVSDPEYLNAELTWQWSGNQNSEIVFGQSSAQSTRPVTITGPNDWFGWERVAFEVSNPIGGAANDTLTVFSVPADGTPIAGGLTGLTLRAGTCVSVDLDDYFYDADDSDFAMTWSVAGNDSITVNIDPVTHVAVVCAPSETWEGQEMLTWAVDDPDGHISYMDTPVLVTGAVLRNVFNVLVFRNPMQEDYMDMFVESSRPLSGLPQLDVFADDDSVRVTLDKVDDDYFHGRYLLPLDLSLGIQNVASMIARGTTSTGKAVQDTSKFAYGRLSLGGGKVVLDDASITLPEGALARDAVVTLVPAEYCVSCSRKTATTEVFTDGTTYTVSMGGADIAAPVMLVLPYSGNSGSGIYRITGDNGLEYVGGEPVADAVRAETMLMGTFVVGYDHTPPRVRHIGTVDNCAVIAIDDFGSGVDVNAFSVDAGGAEVHWSWDSEQGALVVSADNETANINEIEVFAADRTGNGAVTSVDVTLSPRPGAMRVEQNSPNPFNPVTTIQVALSSEQSVSVEVYDLLGRKVRTLLNDRLSAGAHSILWDATDDQGRQVASGVYMYRVTNGTRSVTRKMLFLR